MNHNVADIDALLFDLGGVLIEVDFDRAFHIWSTYSGTPVTQLRARFSADAFYEQHEKGEIEARAYFESLRRSLGIDLRDEHFEEGWNAILGSEIVATTTLLPRLKKHVPLYLFSNSNLTHQRLWAVQHAAMLSHFKQIFVSSEIGKRKPDPDAFLYIAEAIGVAPGRIMFFDDAEQNVEGARHAGMIGIHVKSADSVKNALAAAKLL